MTFKSIVWIFKIIGETVFLLAIIAMFASMLGYGGFLNLPAGVLNNLLIAFIGATFVAFPIFLDRRISRRELPK